ncbi:DNA polymerase [Neomoorella thermoacetica]|uniref:DNA polymerase n=1 Tax=Neomoorella thermoacetica TaxID=1525 RepID=UPI0030CC18C2
MLGLVKMLKNPEEIVFDGTDARKKEGPFDFDAAMAETLARLAAEAPPGVVEWAAANRPDLMAAVDKAAALLDETAADNDAVSFNLALGEYEAAWQAIFDAYRREAATPDAGGVESRKEFSCPTNTGEWYKNGVGGLRTDRSLSGGNPAISGREEKTGDGGKPLESSDKKEQGYTRHNDESRNLPTTGEQPLVGPNKGRSGGPVRGDGQTPPNDMFPKTERQDGVSPDPVQALLFPEMGTTGEKDSRPSASQLPFELEAAPTAWQEWLDRVDVVYVLDLWTWEEAVAAARTAGVCGFDTETTGLDPFVNEIRLLQLAVPVYPAGKKNLVAEDGKGPEPGGSAVAYVADLWRFGPDDRRRMLDSVAALAADPDVSFAGHNLKFDLKFLRSALAAAEGKPRWPGKRFPCERLFDTMLASQLVTAGDFVPEAQFPKWCEEHGVRAVKEGNGPTRYFDRHGHEVKFERDTQKKIRPVYPTHSLKEIAHRHLEVMLDKEEQTSDWSAPELTERQIRYAGMDAAVLLPLREILANLLYKNRMARVAQIEFSALPIVAEIEACGMPFDAEEAWKMEEVVKTAVESARIKLVELARGAGFRARPKKSEGKRYSPDLNPDSSVDVIDCLELLGGREGILIDTEGGSKMFRLPNGEILPLESRDNTLSMVSAALPDGSELKRFISVLKEYRAAKKKADFLRAWIESLHPMTGRLHSDLRQLNPQATGRVSASNPNLLQVGRDKDIRALFKAPEGRKLAICDFSAVEMRLMAELAGDQNMIRTFQEGADIHRRTAAAIAGKPETDVTKAERQAAKACNFGIIYGISPESLKVYAETSYGVSMSLEEAALAREKFFKAYPGVARWHESQRRKSYENGFEVFFRHDALRGYHAEKRPCARTLAGRLRTWPVVKEKSRNGYGEYLRKAGPVTELYNFPDQGSGADLLKSALGNLYRELLTRGWNDAYLVASVHDELVLELPEEKAAGGAALLKEVMEKAGEGFIKNVPIEAEANVGLSWADKA